MRRVGTILIAAAVAALAGAQTSHKEQFGKNLGDDYFLANYQQLTALQSCTCRSGDLHHNRYRHAWLKEHGMQGLWGDEG